MRATPLAIAALLALAPVAAGQGEGAPPAADGGPVERARRARTVEVDGGTAGRSPGDGVTLVDQRAERVTWVVRPSPAAGGALGGVTGAVASRGAWREDLLLLQSGPREDARLVVEVERKGKGGAPGARYLLDLRAESLVVFVAVKGLDAGGAWPRAVYAEGHVRLVVEAPQGQGVIEAEQIMLDLGRERAFVRDAEVRALPRQAIGPLSGKLAGRPLLLRAERLRALGPGRVVADGLLASPCDHGAPHVALSADRLEVTSTEDDPGPLFGALLRRQEDRGGSDAMRGLGGAPRWIDLDGVGLLVVPPFRDGQASRVPVLPFGSWRSDWPVPKVRFGRSNRLGTFGTIELGHGVLSLKSDEWGKLDVKARERVEHYSARGTGADLGLEWDHASPRGAWKGEGFARAFFMDDRADTDRVGTPVPTEHRFWLRGLVREKLPGNVQVDAELSRISDRGVLLEYFRNVAQSDKEQETYVYGRWSDDALAARAIGRFRLNDFQTQLEQVPEVKLDWIHAPLLTDATWGGLYLDVAARGGQLRFRPDEDLDVRSYEAWRGDLEATVSYKQSLGPFVLRAWGGARESAWSARAASDDPLDRFSAHAGWNVATTLWREGRAPLWGGVLRHEVVPEAGTRHVFRTSRDPTELLPFDDVEQLVDTDFAFLRLRSRLLTDLAGRRHKLLDVAVETRYFLSDRGRDVARSWGSLLYDIRLDPTPWLSLRARGEHDLNDGRLLSFDVMGSATFGPVTASAGWRDLPGLARAVNWSLELQLTPAWTVGFAQQYDFVSDRFLFHRARVVRRFHCLALELAFTYNPLQDDMAASFALDLAPLLGGDQAAFERDRWRELY